MNTLLHLTGTARCLLTLAAAALAGCSALQIDVDVYKGPLSNEREIQVRQYAALARSAKPVLVALREDLEKPGSEQKRALDEVRDLLCFYDDFAADKNKNGCDTNRYSRFHKDQARGLKQQLAECARGAVSDGIPGEKGERWIEKGRSQEGIDGLHDRWLETLTHFNMDASRCEVQLAERHLTEALIIFAERMLYVVNNSRLFPVEGQQAEERTILQTLGNTILVHANDLRRQEVHKERQEAAFAGELKATADANKERLPAELKGDVARALDAAITQAKADAVSQSTAVQNARVVAKEAQADWATKNVTQKRTLNDVAMWSPNPWLAALRTLAEPDYTPDYWPDASELKGAALTAAKNDQAALAAAAAAVAGANVVVTSKAVLVALHTWLVNEEPATPLTTERLLRLRATATYLSNHAKALAGVADGKVADVLAAIQAQLKNRKAQTQANWENVVKEAQTAQAQANAAKREMDTQERALAMARTEAIKVASVAVAELAKDKALALYGTAVKTTSDAGLANAEAFRGVLLAALAADKDSATPAFQSAMATVKSATLSGGFAFDVKDYAAAKGRAAPSAMAVVDNVIALLRNRRIRALAEGKNTDAGHLQNAIDAAYEQRASMVYIRPAADYLKNVYSATALQDENASPNRNMLLDYLKRLGPDGKLPAARAQLEKVFWQNINRVSLSGGGNTNYVLAKDDVGNWYVKAYSSDTAQIFESARKLFLFNSGRKLDINLLERADLRERANNLKFSQIERTQAADQLAGKGDYTSPAEQAFATRSQQRYAATYLADAQRHGKALATDYQGWVAGLGTAWGAVLKDAKEADKQTALTELNNAASTLFATQLEKPTNTLRDVAEAEPEGFETTDRSKRVALEVVDALDAGRRYRQQLVKAQEALPLPGLTDPQKAQLLGATKSLLRETLEAMATKRLKSSTTYADALTTVGDVLATK